MFVMSRAIAYGRRAAVLSAVGLALGDWLQSIITAVGLSAILASAPRIFGVIKLFGASYLIILGIATLLGKGISAGQSPNIGKVQSSGWLIAQGFFALNPKTFLFFLAFLPHFVDPNAGPFPLQIFIFGTAFVLLGFMTNSLFGLIGGRVADQMQCNSRFRTATRFVSGGVLVVLGFMAAFAQPTLSMSSVTIVCNPLLLPAKWILSAYQKWL